MYSRTPLRMVGFGVLGTLLVWCFLVLPGRMAGSIGPCLKAPHPHPAEVMVVSVEPNTQALQLSAWIARRFRIPESRALAITMAAFRHSRHYRINPMLVLAVIAAESSYQVHAKNEQARGLMQVVARCHPKIIHEIGGREALFTVNANIEAGTRILSIYLRREHGNLYRALRRYSGSISDTGYVSKVRSEMAEFGEVLNQT